MSKGNSIHKRKNLAILKSYYYIKSKGYGAEKDKYVAGDVAGKGDGRVRLVEDPRLATRFEFFGLRSMEETFKAVTKQVKRLEAIGFKGLVIKSKDVYGDINSIDNKDMMMNIRLWMHFMNDASIYGIIEMSKEEDIDGEPTEEYDTVYSFLSHIKRLRFKEIMQVATTWSKLYDPIQMELAVGYVGNYSASRFALFMDYLNKEIKEDDLLKSLLE